MIISIASGKGGTGKTSLIAAFASLAENKVLCWAFYCYLICHFCGENV